MRKTNGSGVSIIALLAAFGSASPAYAADISIPVPVLATLCLGCLGALSYVVWDEIKRRRQPKVNPLEEQLKRLQQENENLKTDLKNYSTIINMAPYPIWQRDSSLALRYYNLSYSEAVEDLSEKSDGSETPERCLL